MAFRQDFRGEGKLQDWLCIAGERGVFDLLIHYLSLAYTSTGRVGVTVGHGIYINFPVTVNGRERYVPVISCWVGRSSAQTGLHIRVSERGASLLLGPDWQRLFPEFKAGFWDRRTLWRFAYASECESLAKLFNKFERNES